MSDPTKIEIDFDPTVQRMRGIAYHGNTPFDVPFISQITDNLWQGGCEDGLVLPGHIDHVVSLYPWEEYTMKHQVKSYLSVRMYDSSDGSGPNIEQVIDVATWVNAARKTGTVLVHCQAGLNRSSFVAGMALVLRGYPAKDAIALLREKRSPAVLCNSTFEEALLRYDNE